MPVHSAHGAWPVPSHFAQEAHRRQSPSLHTVLFVKRRFFRLAREIRALEAQLIKHGHKIAEVLENGRHGERSRTHP